MVEDADRPFAGDTCGAATEGEEARFLDGFRKAALRLIAFESSKRDSFYRHEAAQKNNNISSAEM